MPLLITTVAVSAAAFVLLVLLLVRGLITDLRHRGEDDFDSHADQAIAVGRAKVPALPEVPEGTGERCVHDFFEWLDKESAS